MATLDFSKSTVSANMADTNLVSFNTFEFGSSTAWSYYTPGGHDLELLGDSMSFDADGHALTGFVSTIRVDLGNDDFDNPDVLITEVDGRAISMNGPSTFWNFLGGNDTITGGSVKSAGLNAFFTLFGDGPIGRGGSTGGNDTISAGNTGTIVYGDVFEVGAPSFSDDGNVYRGGDDVMGGAIGIKGNTDRLQYFYGDAYSVHSFGELVGGNDTMFSTTAASGAQAFGDAASVSDQAKLTGGDDTIHAISGSRATLVGDAGSQTAATVVQGGDDSIFGGDFANLIVGDVLFSAGTLTAGNDSVLGLDGADTIAGDVFEATDAKITGGNDFISGGLGADVIFGEFVSGDPVTIVGGNDRLSGEAGNDQVFGQTGNDTLDGATGADTLSGGLGNDLLRGGAEGDDLDGGAGFDMASYQFAGAGVKVSLSDATVREGEALGDSLAGVEALRGSAFNDLLAGDALANLLLGEDGKDILQGLGGNDLIEGGTGADFLSGGLGNDSFRFTAPAQGGDRIADFANAAGNNDVLIFEGAAFGGLPTGALSAIRFIANASGLATTADQRFVYETDTGILRFDANGSAAGGATTIATFTGAPVLTLADFAII